MPYASEIVYCRGIVVVVADVSNHQKDEDGSQHHSTASPGWRMRVSFAGLSEKPEVRQLFPHGADPEPARSGRVAGSWGLG